MNCRHCHKKLAHKLVDLGHAPPSNAYLTEGALNEQEIYYPLRVMVCDSCWLVQTEDYAGAEQLFTNEYGYFSSTSLSWLDHAKEYSDQIIEELKLDSSSKVIEIASNDGYLLRNFISAEIPCLGIEPTASTAIVAESQGIPVIREFFTEELGIKLALERGKANLIIGNNVYAHVPDINDFTKGLKAALDFNGTITLEFPHLLQLVENVQFDTIYHEHFSYLSLYTVSKIFSEYGLRVWNVQELLTHGGSLRVYGCHDDDPRQTRPIVTSLMQKEADYGLREIETYLNFQPKVDKIKNDLLAFLIKAKFDGKKVGAYGAAAKGSTLLNYAGVKPDLLPFVCDAGYHKQGKFLPGSHLPIKSPDYLKNHDLDYIVVFPWNIANEIIKLNSGIVSSKTKYIRAVPELKFI